MEKENAVKKIVRKGINTLDYIDAIPYIIINRVSNKVLKDYKLNKELNKEIIKEISITPIEIPESYNFNNKNDIHEDLKKYLTDFTNLISLNFSKEDLRNFYKNINTLVIQYYNFNIVNTVYNSKMVGIYLQEKNAICIDENKFTPLKIHHELFHMASSLTTTDINYSGFMQENKKDKISIGNGINEGYTQLLTERYFSEDIIGLVYNYNTNISYRLEQIIGKDKMEHLYMTANLKGLIDELLKYASYEEIMKFIKTTDFAFDNLRQKDISLKRKKIIGEALSYNNEFLYKTYATKIKEEFLNKNITLEELNNDLNKFYHSLIYIYVYDENQYKYFPVEKAQEIIDQIFNITSIKKTNS